MHIQPFADASIDLAGLCSKTDSSNRQQLLADPTGAFNSWPAAFNVTNLAYSSV